MIGLPDVTALYGIIAFGICFAILKKYLFVPLAAILEARENESREAERAYTESLHALERAVAAGEEKLAAARRDALKTREALRAEGLDALERRLADARGSADRSIRQASADIEAQSAVSVRELPERARSLARELAEKILGRKLAA
jgi:F-type H+-transporting ATPase subunit b